MPADGGIEDHALIKLHIPFPPCCRRQAPAKKGPPDFAFTYTIGCNPQRAAGSGSAETIDNNFFLIEQITILLYKNFDTVK
jgi:hypothetical protein